VIELESQMREAADALDFERAIQLRDTVKRLEKEMREKEMETKTL
jgi:excinuclease ABC subunit B